jgi:hypothetical protein
MGSGHNTWWETEESLLSKQETLRPVITDLREWSSRFLNSLWRFALKTLKFALLKP